MKLTKPILTLEIIPESNEIQQNVFGYERISIYHFNYDGKGSAIASFDDNDELESIGNIDLDEILFGDAGSGIRWYRPV